jgi:hypothetical protein
LREFRVIERRHADYCVLDARQLQETHAHLFDRIVATREDDAYAAVVRGQRHEVAERVARGLLEQALHALDEDDLTALRREDGPEGGGIRRNVGGGERPVEMRLCEFVDTKAEGEVIPREERDGTFVTRRLAPD